MPIPLQITYRGMAPISSVDELLEDQVRLLERFSDQIIRCHVTVSVPHRHHRNGRHYSVHVDIVTPFGGVFVTQDPDPKGASEELDVLVRDVFEAAIRQVREGTRRRRSA